MFNSTLDAFREIFKFWTCQIDPRHASCMYFHLEALLLRLLALLSLLSFFETPSCRTTATIQVLVMTYMPDSALSMFVTVGWEIIKRTPPNY